MYARDEDGNIASAPPWRLVLSYDHAVRAKAMKLILEEGRTFADALPLAWCDTVTKERCFTTPLGQHSKSMKRNVPQEWADDGPEFKKSREGPKGKGKGKVNKGKKKVKGQVRDCSVKTPDGKNICFAYNNQDEKCSRDKCNFTRVCGKCFGDHPMYHCKKA